MRVQLTVGAVTTEVGEFTGNRENWQDKLADLLVAYAQEVRTAKIDGDDGADTAMSAPPPAGRAATLAPGSSPAP